MPNEGVYVSRKISLNEAKNILHNHVEYLKNPFTSALGHQGSVDAFNALFEGLNCELNRIQVQMSHGDEALCIKVLGRLPEGAILDFDTLQEIGFEFYHVTCFAGLWTGET